MKYLTKQNLKRWRQAPRLLFQPITYMPADRNVVLSDLFVWRCDENWRTVFELVHPNFFMGISFGTVSSSIMLFDASGQAVGEKEITWNATERCSVDLSVTFASEIVSLAEGLGTFSVFHNGVAPEIFEKCSSWVTERGYVAYYYKGACFGSFAHGNYDAISRNSSGVLQCLGGKSIFPRGFNLQYCFEPNSQYEVVFTNPTSASQNLNLTLKNQQLSVVSKTKLRLDSRGVGIDSFQTGSDAVYLTVSSRLVMARPIVISIKGEIIDVFHG